MDNIEDLLNQDLSSPIEEGVLFSNVYRVIKGGFDLEGVETYLGSAFVSHLTEDIEIFEKLTEDKSWPVSSIIQRDVEERRVTEIANNYILKSSNNVKYFPPIVIAIVPRENNEEISKEFKLTDKTPAPIKGLIRSKGGYSSKLADNFESSKNLSNLDGFYVLDWFQELGQYPLSWDKEKVYAIVIDGQHRLEALKLAAKRKSDIKKYSLDVVFIDLSKKASKEGRSPVEAVRRIFIDINYNAKPVTNARRTLMDDKDLSSLIVQSLVNDDDQNGERKGFFLLPQLVDWHSENLKHSFPLLTGVLVLQQLIEDNFLQGSNLASFSDLRDRKKVAKFVGFLNSMFKVDEKIKTKTKYSGIEPLEISYKKYKESLEKSSEDEEKEDLLFNMDYNVLNVARDSFEEYYSRGIVKFFNEFYPYKKAISILQENSVFDITDKRNRIIIKNPKKRTTEERELLDSIKTEMHNSLDEKFYLCYTVLGQKTFFRQYYKELFRHLHETGVNEAAVVNFTQKWLSTMSVIIKNLENSKIFSHDQKFVINPEILRKYSITEYGLIASSFWQGIIYNDQNIIYNTQGIGGFLGVLEYLYKSYPIKRLEGEGGKINFPDESIWMNIPYSLSRIKRKVQQEFPFLESTSVEEIADSIWRAKLEQLKITISENNS